jgi:hypothetical protein
MKHLCLKLRHVHLEESQEHSRRKRHAEHPHTDDDLKDDNGNQLAIDEPESSEESSESTEEDLAWDLAEPCMRKRQSCCKLKSSSKFLVTALCPKTCEVCEFGAGWRGKILGVFKKTVLDYHKLETK